MVSTSAPIRVVINSKQGELTQVAFVDSTAKPDVEARIVPKNAAEAAFNQLLRCFSQPRRAPRDVLEIGTSSDRRGKVDPIFRSTKSQLAAIPVHDLKDIRVLKHPTRAS